MRLREQCKTAMHGVAGSTFSLLSNSLSVFIGLAFFGLLLSLSLGVGLFLEQYYTRTVSLTTLLVFNDPAAAGSEPFDKPFRLALRGATEVDHVFFHDIAFGDVEMSQGRKVTVALRAAQQNDPEIERLERLAGGNLPQVANPCAPAIVLSVARARRLSDDPPASLIGREVALTVQRWLDDDEPDHATLYGRIAGIVRETPDESVYVPYQTIACITAWQRSLTPSATPAVEAPEFDADSADAPSTVGPAEQSPPAPSAAPAGDGLPDDETTNCLAGGDAATAIEDAPAKESQDDAVSRESTSDFPLTGGAQKGFTFLTLPAAWEALQPQVAGDDLVYPHLRLHVDSIDTVATLRKHFTDRGYPTTCVLDDVQAIRELRGYVVMVGSLIGLITLIAATCSIFNTLLASVQRRTREIGVLRALGASRGNVLAIFLLEGVLHALLGSSLAIAAVGAAVKWGNTGLLNRLAIHEEFAELVALQPRLFVFPGWLPVVLIGVGVLAAVVAAIGPALRACWIQPTKALQE